MTDTTNTLPPLPAPCPRWTLGDIVTLDACRQYGDARAAHAVAPLHALIDALMLEYCPDEMPPEQVEEWARHQKVSDVVVPIKAREVTDAEIDALCKDFERLTDAFARVKHNAEHAGDDLARTLRSIVFIADAAIALANGRG